MSLESVQQEFRSKLKTLGKAGLHSLFPKDFENYLIAFELVDSDGFMEEYFAFPIIPTNIRESQTERNTIKTTAGGVVVIDKDTFIPTNIDISGTFGRKLKLVINNSGLEFAGFRLTRNGIKRTQQPVFSSFAKTGYGCIKIIESLKKRSRQEGYTLYLYNSILGNNYAVKFNQFEHWQDEQNSNMLPQYSLSLTSIAPLDSLKGAGGFNDILRNTLTGAIQNNLNSAISSVRAAFNF